MWKPGFVRTNVEYLSTKIKEELIFVARFNGSLAGCVEVEADSKNEIGQFGMLVVDPKYRGKKIATQLVTASE